MLAILNESIKGYNLPFTILLGVIICYWIIALFGLVSLEHGGDAHVDADMDAHVDIDAHVDVEAHIDADADAHVDSHASHGGSEGGFMGSFLNNIGVSDAPIILIISIFSLLLWVFNMIANLAFNEPGSGARASLLLIPVFIGAMVGTRLLIRPLRPLMKFIRSAEPPTKIIGEQAIVKSVTLDEDFGRIELLFDGKPLLLNAVLSKGQEPLNKGATVLIVSKMEDFDIYIVRPL